MGVSVNVAILLVASSVTVPVGFVQSAGHVNVNVAPPMSGDIASLKVAVNDVVVMGTPMAPFAGVAAVTVGASVAVPFVPKMGSCEPQPVSATPNSSAAQPISQVDCRSSLFIGFTLFDRPQDIIGIVGCGTVGYDAD